MDEHKENIHTEDLNAKMSDARADDEEVGVCAQCANVSVVFTLEATSLFIYLTC